MIEIKVTKDDYKRWREEQTYELRLIHQGLKTSLIGDLTRITEILRTSGRATSIDDQEFSFRATYETVLSDLEKITERARDVLREHYSNIDRYTAEIKRLEDEEADHEADK